VDFFLILTATASTILVLIEFDALMSMLPARGKLLTLRLMERARPISSTFIEGETIMSPRVVRLPLTTLLGALPIALAACGSYVPPASSSGTDANASAYFDDGCRAGTADKQAGLSMAYQRKAGAYDSRYESTYQAGYEKCWNRTNR